jgi:hypothetical protein
MPETTLHVTVLSATVEPGLPSAEVKVAPLVPAVVQSQEFPPRWCCRWRAPRSARPSRRCLPPRHRSPTAVEPTAPEVFRHHLETGRRRGGSRGSRRCS